MNDLLCGDGIEPGPIIDTGLDGVDAIEIPADVCSIGYIEAQWERQGSPTCLDCDNDIILIGTPDDFRLEHISRTIWDHEPVGEALWLRRLKGSETGVEYVRPRVKRSRALMEWVKYRGVTCMTCGIRKPLGEFPARRPLDTSACLACGSRSQRLSLHPREPYTRIQIARRDQWTCGICHGSIDHRLMNPYDPGYLNIDHIIPVSSPKFPGDILSNVQATHRLCNIKKGGVRR